MSSRFPRNSLTAVWVSTCPPISWEFEVLQKNTCQSHVLSSHNSFHPRCEVKQLVLYVSHSVTVLFPCLSFPPANQWSDISQPPMRLVAHQLTVKYNSPGTGTQHIAGPWLTDLHLWILWRPSTWQLKHFFFPGPVMASYHKPKMFRSLEGCCICKAKSSR